MENCTSSTIELLDAPSRRPWWDLLKTIPGRLFARIVHFWRVDILHRPLPIDRWITDRGDQTLRLDYPLSSSSVVVDVGGFHGDWSRQILDLYGCKIHIFEPVSASWQKISRRFEGCAKISVYPYGLAGASGQMQIAILGDASNVFTTGSEQVEAAELRDVAEVLAPLRHPCIDLIKINIEGGEYDLLDRMIQAGIARACRNIQVQFHSWMPGAVERRRSIQTALSATHRLTYEYPFVWENWRLKD